MGNRTFESGLLIARNDATDAMDGHTVVIYEDSARGLTFVQEINAAQKFSRSVLKRYRAWAVNRAPEFVQETVAHLTLERGPHYEFDTVISIHVAADNAHTIVGWRETDPLDVVVKNANERVARELRDHRQEEIEEDFNGIAKRATDKLLPHLKQHAAGFGLALLDVAIRPVWPDEKIKKDRARREADDRHDTVLGSLAHAHEERTVELENKRDRASLEEEVQYLEDRRVHNSSLRNAKTKGVIKAIDQVSSSVENIDDFSHAAHVLGALPDGGKHGSTDGSDALRRPLLTDGSIESAPLRHLLNEGVSKVDRLSCRPEDKRKIYSHFLGLVSEALNDSPDHAAVEARREALSTTLYEARPKIPQAQVESWNGLTSLDRLREQLGLA